MAGHQPHHIHQQDNDHPNDEGAPTNVADCCMCNEPSHRHPCHSSSSSSGGCRTHQARTPPSNSAVVALDPASTSTPPIPFTRQHPHHALHWLGLGILTTTLLRKHHYHHITLFGRQRSTFYPFDAGQGQNFVVKGLLFFGLGYLVADVVNKRRALISARGKWQATHHNVKSECRKEKTPKGWKVILTAEAEMQGSELKDEEQVSPASKGNNNTDNDVEKSAAQPGIWVGSSADDHHHRHHHQHSPNQSSHQDAPAVRDPLHKRLDEITNSLNDLALQVFHLQSIVQPTSELVSEHGDFLPNEANDHTGSEQFTVITP